MEPGFLSHISAVIRDATQQPCILRGATPVGGGDINKCFRLEGADGTRYFLKVNDARHYPMFVAEAAGLEAIAATETIRVPEVVVHGSAGRQSFLVLEHLELNSRGGERQLGERLAALHRCSGTRFGFAHDNFIGTTPQPNAWKEDWVDFWRRERLGFQLELAKANGYCGELQRLGARLMDALPAFFDGYALRPSLLHGDLWGGNHGFLADGMPVIFDPAAYYGDRECDLAMTELFGGYGADFYAAYHASWPLASGYTVRKNLYNLYHILNHANLFGGGYAGQAEKMILRLLSGFD